MRGPIGCRLSTNLNQELQVGQGAAYLVDSLGQLPAAELSTELLRGFMEAQLATGASPASVNRRVEVVRHAFRLAQRERRLASTPHFPRLQEKNVRKGFFARERFEADDENPHPMSFVHYRRR